MSPRTSEAPAVTAGPSLDVGSRARPQAFALGALIAAVVYAAGTLGGAIGPHVLAIVVICSSLAGVVVVAAVLSTRSARGRAGSNAVQRGTVGPFGSPLLAKFTQYCCIRPETRRSAGVHAKRSAERLPKT